MARSRLITATCVCLLLIPCLCNDATFAGGQGDAVNYVQLADDSADEQGWLSWFFADLWQTDLGSVTGKVSDYFKDLVGMAEDPSTWTNFEDLKAKFEELTGLVNNTWTTFIDKRADWEDQAHSLVNDFKTAAGSSRGLVWATLQSVKSNMSLASAELVAQISDVGAAQAAQIWSDSIENLKADATGSVSDVKAQIEQKIMMLKSKLTQLQNLTKLGESTLMTTYRDVTDAVAGQWGSIQGQADALGLLDIMEKLRLKDIAEKLEDKMTLMQVAVRAKAEQLGQMLLIPTSTFQTARADLELKLKVVQEGLEAAQGQALELLLAQQKGILDQMTFLQTRIDATKDLFWNQLDISMEKITSLQAHLEAQIASIELQKDEYVSSLFDPFKYVDIKKELDNQKAMLQELLLDLNLAKTAMTLQSNLHQDDYGTTNITDALQRIAESNSQLFACNSLFPCNDTAIADLVEQLRSGELQIEDVQQLLATARADADEALVRIASHIAKNTGSLQQRFTIVTDKLVKSQLVEQLVFWKNLTADTWNVIFSHSAELENSYGQAADSVAADLRRLYARQNLSSLDQNSSVVSEIMTQISSLESYYRRLRSAMTGEASSGRIQLSEMSRLLSSSLGEWEEESWNSTEPTTSNAVVTGLRNVLTKLWETQSLNMSQTFLKVSEVTAHMSEQVGSYMVQLDLGGSWRDQAQMSLSQMNMTNHLAHIRGAVRERWTKQWDKLELVKGTFGVAMARLTAMKETATGTAQEAIENGLQRITSTYNDITSVAVDQVQGLIATVMSRVQDIVPFLRNQSATYIEVINSVTDLDGVGKAFLETASTRFRSIANLIAGLETSVDGRRLSTELFAQGLQGIQQILETAAAYMSDTIGGLKMLSLNLQEGATDSVGKIYSDIISALSDQRQAVQLLSLDIEDKVSSKIEEWAATVSSCYDLFSQAASSMAAESSADGRSLLEFNFIDEVFATLNDIQMAVYELLGLKKDDDLKELSSAAAAEAASAEVTDNPAMVAVSASLLSPLVARKEQVYASMGTFPAHQDPWASIVTHDDPAPAAPQTDTGGDSSGESGNSNFLFIAGGISVVVLLVGVGGGAVFIKGRKTTEDSREFTPQSVEMAAPAASSQKQQLTQQGFKDPRMPPNW